MTHNQYPDQRPNPASSLPPRARWYTWLAVAVLLAGAAAGGRLLWFRHAEARWPWEPTFLDREEAEQLRKYGPRILKMIALSDILYDVQYSPDGRHVALALGRTVEIRDARTFTLAGKWEEQGGCTSLSFHPTKPWIACGLWRAKGVVDVRTWPEGTLVKALETDTDGVNYDGATTQTESDEHVQRCEISPCGRYLATITVKGKGIPIFDTEKWMQVTEIPSPHGGAWSVRFFPKGDLILCDLGGHDKAVRTVGDSWDIRQFPVAVFRDAYVCGGMDAGATFVAYTTPGASFELRSIEDGRTIMACDTAGSLYPKSIDVAPDGDIVAAGDEHRYAYFWSVPERRLVDKVKFGGPVKQVRLSPDGREAVIGLGRALARFQVKGENHADGGDGGG